jgi:acyl-CoA synthetase (AMP-forming)/AMP-acid ligase II
MDIGRSKIERFLIRDSIRQLADGVPFCIFYYFCPSDQVQDEMKAAIYDRKTLAELLLTAAKDFPDRGTGFVQPDGSIIFMKYPELLSRARSMASALRAGGMSPGDKVMIIMTRNEEIIPVVWACFLGGLVPTILQPPVSFTEFNQPAKKIINVFRILGKPGIILSSDLLHGFQTDVIPPENLIDAEELKKTATEIFLEEPDENDIAFIQFSSGSTGDPKGIVLTHKNILTNLAAISVGLDIHDSDIMTNWMPLYHDMGFFGFHLTPVFANSNHFLLDPVDFVKKPTLWLDVLDEVKSTITGCPNFGQALLLRYLKNREEKNWDLSALKAIVNGAEPISTRIMSDFMNKLSANGLKKESMMPAYGMAEATLAITFYDLWKEPVISSFNRTMLQKEGRAIPETEHVSEMMELVSVGYALKDTEIRVVDEKGHVKDEQLVGNIQIRGAGITTGYYNNPEETNDSFVNGWLKTGDTGFIFNGELFITGRVKDIIFVRGQNLYAHDLENLAAKYSDVGYGKLIIGGWFDPEKGQDQIILFLVGSANAATCQIFLDLRNFFRDTYGITIDVFVPVRSNQVPKTSSGKIQRYKLISDYQNGEFDDAIAELKKLMRD